MPDAIRSREDCEFLISGYDASILYWDRYFGQHLDLLHELGIADDTAIIVNGDHGESLGENGSYAEHSLANEPTLRVALIAYWPGVRDALVTVCRHRTELI